MCVYVCVSELNKSAVMLCLNLRLLIGDVSRSSGRIVWQGQWDTEFGDGLSTSLFVLHRNAFKTKRGQLIEREREREREFACVCVCVDGVCVWMACVCVCACVCVEGVCVCVCVCVYGWCVWMACVCV